MNSESEELEDYSSVALREILEATGLQKMLFDFAYNWFYLIDTF